MWEHYKDWSKDDINILFILWQMFVCQSGTRGGDLLWKKKDNNADGTIWL